MIIHCTTPQQIEDVIKTESMNMYASPEKIFKSYGSNSCINNGSYGSLDFYKSYGYTITPYVEWKENKMNDQFIQLEGGKLNITKARELGLFVEDKKVFTVDKDCEIKYNEYVIESYESLGLGRCVCISNRASKHVVIINPTPDKVRHEFEYYGIEVDVYDR